MTDRFTFKRVSVVRCVGLIVSTFAMGVAVSQTLPKEGPYDYISCWSGTSNDIAFSKTHGFGTYEFVVNNRTSPPGGPFDMTVGRCVGLGSVLDGKRDNSSSARLSTKMATSSSFATQSRQASPSRRGSLEPASMRA